MSVEDVLDEIQDQTGSLVVNTRTIETDLQAPKNQKGLVLVGGVAMYGGDAVVRRASALQSTQDAIDDSNVGLSEATAVKLKVSTGDSVLIKQLDVEVTATVFIDKGLAENCVAIPSGTSLSAGLSAQGSELSLKKMTQTNQNADDIVRASNA